MERVISLKSLPDGKCSQHGRRVGVALGVDLVHIPQSALPPLRLLAMDRNAQAILTSIENDETPVAELVG